jgi:plasmid stabilization system protein ParE
MLSGYRLTSEAASDIKGILDYTLDRWGADQAGKYVCQLEQCLRDLVSGRRSGKSASDELPEVRVVHCEHHYVFYITQDSMLAVVAILHEAMDLVSRLRERLE